MDAAVLATVALLLRVPFPSKWLWAWDSVLYARAIDDLSIGSGGPLEQRPHPPGYVFYVLAARGLSWLNGDANGALVAVSVIAGRLGSSRPYEPGKPIFGRIRAGRSSIASPGLSERTRLKLVAPMRRARWCSTRVPSVGRSAAA